MIWEQTDIKKIKTAQILRGNTQVTSTVNNRSWTVFIALVKILRTVRYVYKRAG